MTISTSEPDSLTTIRNALLDKALDVGFDMAAIAAPDAIRHASSRLHDFVANGMHGDMDWMERNIDRRADPLILWPDVKSVLVVAMNYGPATDPLLLLDHPDHAAISCYAQNRDYHDVLKKKLKRLGRWLGQKTGTDLKVFVDTAPVAEKPLAQAAGIGWQGKHTNLVSRTHGSWLFLGCLFSTLDLAPHQPETDHCGNCQKCLDICPTGAFPAPYKLDARRCISYLTIEHKGPIPLELRTAIGNRIYGCDDCLAVCPWNKFASRTTELAFQPRHELDSPRLTELATFDDSTFRQYFSGSAIKRIGRDRFIRNVLVALGNCGDKNVLTAVQKHLDDSSPVVRDAAIWAISRLASAEQYLVIRSQYQASEPNDSVRALWDRLEPEARVASAQL